jgi:hypothetical protein
VAFCTLTMRHHNGQGLPALWDALSAAWNKVTGGKAWLTNKRHYGIAGWLRVVEVTHGRNGWHVHIHALVFIAGKQTEHLVQQLHAAMFGRWSSALEKQGLAAPLMVGQDAHLVTNGGDRSLAEYFTKATDRRPSETIGLEVTQSQTKKSRDRHKTRTPWALLDDVEDLGLADSLGLWHEWERGSKGRKQMTWSMGFRAELGLLVEQTDEELVEVEHGSADDDLVLIDAAGWSQLTRRPLELADLLTAAQNGGLSAVRAFLDSRGVTYSLPGGDR